MHFGNVICFLRSCGWVFGYGQATLTLPNFCCALAETSLWPWACLSPLLWSVISSAIKRRIQAKGGGSGHLQIEMLFFFPYSDEQCGPLFSFHCHNALKQGFLSNFFLKATLSFVQNKTDGESKCLKQIDLRKRHSYRFWRWYASVQILAQILMQEKSLISLVNLFLSHKLCVTEPWINIVTVPQHFLMHCRYSLSGIDCYNHYYQSMLEPEFIYQHISRKVYNLAGQEKYTSK